MPNVSNITLRRLLNAKREVNKSKFGRESECVADLDYNPETNVMKVEFKHRGTYEYDEVPLDEYVDFAEASSLGIYFNLYIRNKGYSYRRIQ